MKKEQLRLYAVTDRTWLGNETLYEQVEKALEGGATLVQLREKELRIAACAEGGRRIAGNSGFSPAVMQETLLLHLLIA